MQRRSPIWLLWALVLIAADPTLAEPEDERARYQALARSEATFKRAVAAHRRGDLERAEQSYREAIEADPAFVEAMVNLARVHVARGELDQAALWLDEAEVQRPLYPGIRAARGLLAFESGDAMRAVDALSQARSARPRDVEVLTNLGAGLVAQGRQAEAVEVLLEAHRLDPNRATPVFNLAVAYDKSGDVPRAGHYYARYLELAGRRNAMALAVRDRIAVLAGQRPPRTEVEPVPPVGAGFENPGLEMPVSGGE